jgi:outer membrane receptor protein involved in Fe transport
VRGLFFYCYKISSGNKNKKLVEDNMKNFLLFIIAVLALAILPNDQLFAGISGKVSGKVVDSESKEALPGANVIIEGAPLTLGAATDVNGEFIILNVPPGTFAVKTRLIGYRTVTIRNVIVSVDLTTNVNFEMPTEAVAMNEVVITAERPLVNKNATNETHVMTSEDIENMPLRNYAAIVATSTGVVTARNDLYVRGGRRDEVAYYVDGVYSNDLRTGTRVGDVPIASLEQINYQAGGFSAEYGFANSGVVVATSKAGANDFSFGGEVVTDEFLSQDTKTLGTYSYGYHAYNATISGPLLSEKLRYFASAENTFNRDQSPSSGTHPVLVGSFTQDQINLTKQQLQQAGVPMSDWILPVKNISGPLPNNALSRWSLNGNLLYDLKPLRIKVGGNGTFSNYSEYNQYRTLVNYSHSPKDKDFSYSMYGKVTHTLSPRTYYEATGYYMAYGNERSDPVFGRYVADYGDATDFNQNGVFAPYLSQDGLNTTDKLRLGTGVFQPIASFDDYDLNRANVLGAKFDLTHQVGSVHEIKTGFEYRYNTLRRYNLNQPVKLAGVFSVTPDIDPRLAYRTGYTDNFGYPIQFSDDIVDPSNTLDSGDDAAKHPVLAAFYLQDKIELSDLVLNLGLRWDYIDARDKQLKDPYNVIIKDGFLDFSQLEDTKGNSSISPRIGLSFPVTDRTVFHAQWGKFTQQPELQYLYSGWDYLAGQVSQGNQVAIGNPALKPVKTTAYEIGVGQQLGMNASLNITAFYKEIRDLLVLKNRVNAKPATYAQYQNGDYGTIKGLSLTLKLRRTERISANVNYTLQYAAGTGSTAGSAFYITWIGQDNYYPSFVAPLDFDQRHTLSANFDFRTEAQDGPMFFGGYPFGNMGLNVLAQVGSGFPYTPKRIADTIFAARFSTSYPIAATNSAYTNWTYDIGLRLDKTITLSNMEFDIYLWVLNALGSQLPFNRRSDRGQVYGLANDTAPGIYEATGRPDDNGWLDTPDGQKWIADNGGERAAALYRAFINDPRNWVQPRQIRLGVRFNINPNLW